MSVSEEEREAWEGWVPESPPHKRDAHRHGFEEGYRAARAARDTQTTGAEKLADTIVTIAYCPEHGLHGARDTCFVCGEPVEQVPVRVLPAREDTERPNGGNRARELEGKLLELVRIHHRSHEGVAPSFRNCSVLTCQEVNAVLAEGMYSPHHPTSLWRGGGFWRCGQCSASVDDPCHVDETDPEQEQLAHRRCRCSPGVIAVDCPEHGGGI